MKIRWIAIAVSASLMAACGSTGIVKLEENRYMVSEKNAKVGFDTAAEEKASVYHQANEYCAQYGKEVKTINLEMRNSGFGKQASATLEFSCVAKE
jgi:formamidopyrimidine-DNA glycosylase